jgi:hypothetical protein
MPSIEVPTPETTVGDVPPSEVEGEVGHWEFRFRPPRPGL